MIDPTTIRKRAASLYQQWVKTWLSGQSDTLFPVRLPVGTLPDDTLTLPDAIEALRREEKNSRRAGYRITKVQRRTKRHGIQTVPEAIWIDTPHDLLALADKTTEFANLSEDVGLIRQRLPQLEIWLRDNPRLIVQYHGRWSELLTVCEYWVAHPNATVQPVREIPVPLPTKFIEQHESVLRQLAAALETGEVSTFRAEAPMLRLRCLGGQFQRLTGLALDDLTVPLLQASHLSALGGQIILIAENKTTFLSLPRLTEVIAVWGEGYSVDRLGQVEWLAKGELFYWGDIDAHGFEILSRARGYFPSLTSLMMDTETFDNHQQWVVAGTPAPLRDLPNLTSDEKTLYERVTRSNLRLEQERIPSAWRDKRLAIVEQ